MNNMLDRCPECGALYADGKSCNDDFYTLLGWENRYPGYGEVHHLTVLCFYLQHPSLYSPDGLAYAKGLLIDFLEKGKTTEEVRRENRSRVSSTNRKWNVKAKGGSHGSYENAVQWIMRAADVADDEHIRYRENVRHWAASILDSLRASGNI